MKHVVWYGGPFALHTCPVRELDPEADFYIGWLHATHTQTEHGWAMTQLPAAGGVGAQDARLMQGIAVARAEANAFLAEQLSDRRRAQQTDDYLQQLDAEARA